MHCASDGTPDYRTAPADRNNGNMGTLEDSQSFDQVLNMRGVPLPAPWVEVGRHHRRTRRYRDGKVNGKPFHGEQAGKSTATMSKVAYGSIDLSFSCRSAEHLRGQRGGHAATHWRRGYMAVCI
jgi:hypothetical protein